MTMFLFWCAIGIVAGTVFASGFEWTLHRYLMHRSFLVKIFRYPFERHTLVHHHVFKYDHSYHLIHEPDKKTIPMAWWNGPVILALVLLPFLAWSLFSHRWGVLCGAALISTLYFTAYEYMHWCMHLPKKRHVERSGIFFRLNGHHLLHHRYMNKNSMWFCRWPICVWERFCCVRRSLLRKRRGHRCRMFNRSGLSDELLRAVDLALASGCR